MKRRDFLRISATALAASPFLGSAFADEKKKPNIILIFTDDQGYADLGVQDVVKDVKTPHIDSLAKTGVRCTSGYITAPQCSPSRAGLMTGRYQQRFGVDTIPDMPLPTEEVTVAEYLKKQGYATGISGKWHLLPGRGAKRWRQNRPDAWLKDPDTPAGNKLNPKYHRMYSPGNQGFDEWYMNVGWFDGHYRWANYSALGNGPFDPQGQYTEETTGDRLDDETAGGLEFIRRHHDEPFFLYLAYSGPHTPLFATEERLARFPGEMPERRRTALAMMATIDDGVGQVLDLLRKYDIEENTLIFYASDNGAPLKLHKKDEPMTPDPEYPKRKQINMGGWDGSLNDPWVGEKGMIAEGGIRVPFIVRWKGKLPEGKVYDQPVISLDFTATSLAAAGMEVPEIMDGVNLLPYLSGKKEGIPHEALYWRFWKQAAIRMGDWKLLVLGDGREMLFNVENDIHENENLADKHPEKVKVLREKLTAWTQELKPKGLPKNGIGPERGFYQHYFDHQ